MNRADWDGLSAGAELWPKANPNEQRLQRRPHPYIVVKRGLNSVTARREPLHHEQTFRWAHDGANLYRSRMAAIRAAQTDAAEKVKWAKAEVARCEEAAGRLAMLRREEEEYLEARAREGAFEPQEERDE